MDGGIAFDFYAYLVEFFLKRMLGYYFRRIRVSDSIVYRLVHRNKRKLTTERYVV